MKPCDLALCLAVDVSASVDTREFGLMIGGYAAAFRQPDIGAALAAGPQGAAALCLLFWSGPGAQEVAVPWQRLDGGAAARDFADAIELCPRLPRPGGTALGEGLGAGLALLAQCPADPPRLVLDISGDGANNLGRPPAPVRDIGVGAGVVINALAVVNEEPDLLEYYQAHVIGGDGAFALSCPDYDAFAEAIRRKLMREISAALIA